MGLNRRQQNRDEIADFAWIAMLALAGSGLVLATVLIR